MTPADPYWDAAFVRAALAARRPTVPSVEAMVLVSINRDAGTRPFNFVGSDRNRYWAKWPGNPHGTPSLAAELIVHTLGLRLGAPVAPSTVISVADELMLDIQIDGVRPPPGMWFASQVVEDVTEQTALESPRAGGDPARLPRLLALWDLCMGEDQQFLYEGDRRLWSFDHGLWFGGTAPWRPGALEGCVVPWGEPHWGPRKRPLSSTELHAAADAVASLDLVDLAFAVGRVPIEWGIPDSQLLDFAACVHARRAGVSARLRARATRRRGGGK